MERIISANHLTTPLNIDWIEEGTSTMRRQFCRADLFCIALLIITSIFIRLPSLHWEPLNPDECWYEAHSSYLHATHRSAFSTPTGPVFTVAVYRQMANVFGPYCLSAVRGLVLLLCIFVVFTIYLLVRQVGRPLEATIAATVFLFLNPYYEGLSANREWFSLIGSSMSTLLFAMTLKTQSTRVRYGMFFFSGLLAGTSIWFKEQAGVLALAIPFALLMQAIVEREFRGPSKSCAFYALGGLCAGALYCLPFFLEGTLKEYLSFLTEFGQSYGLKSTMASGRWKDSGFASIGAVYFAALFQNHPFRWLHSVVFVFTGLVFAVMFWRFAKPNIKVPTTLIHPITVVTTLQFILAILVAQIGSRFFLHYFLFVIAPAGALFGLTLTFLREEGNERWKFSCSCIFLLVVTSDLLVELSSQSWLTGKAFFISSSIAIAVLVAVIFRSLFLARQDSRNPSPREGNERTLPLYTAFLIAGSLLLMTTFLDTPRLPRYMMYHVYADAKFSKKALPGPWMIGIAALGAITILCLQNRWRRNNEPVHVTLTQLILIVGVMLMALKSIPLGEMAARLQHEGTIPEEVGKSVLAKAMPGDRLFVWGWRPEIYSFTGLTAATEFPALSNVMNEDLYSITKEIKPRRPLVERLMRELKESQPRIIVTLGIHTIAISGDPTFYDPANLPEFQALLKTEYDAFPDPNGTTLYVRRASLP